METPFTRLNDDNAESLRLDCKRQCYDCWWVRYAECGDRCHLTWTARATAKLSWPSKLPILKWVGGYWHDAPLQLSAKCFIICQGTLWRVVVHVHWCPLMLPNISFPSLLSDTSGWCSALIKPTLTHVFLILTPKMSRSIATIEGIFFLGIWDITTWGFTFHN